MCLPRQTNFEQAEQESWLVQWGATALGLGCCVKLPFGFHHAYRPRERRIRMKSTANARIFVHRSKYEMELGTAAAIFDRGLRPRNRRFQSTCSICAVEP